MRSVPYRKVVLALPLLAATVTCVLSFSHQSSNAASSSPGVVREPDAAAAQLAPFLRDRTAADEVGALASRSILATQDERYGLNLALSRRVSSPSSKAPRYIVPGAGVVGVFDDAGGGAVIGSAEAAEGLFVGLESCQGLPTGTVRVLGLLPSEASLPALVLRDDTQVPLDAQDGFYELTVEVADGARLPRQVVWTAGGKQHAVDVPGADDSLLESTCRPAP
jgi:hypothetical protein